MTTRAHPSPLRTASGGADLPGPAASHPVVTAGDPIAAEELRRLLSYSPETGQLFWKPREGSAWWNARYARREAFTCTSPKGYKVGAIHGRVLRAHRVIWAIQTGAWPSAQIDHIDCNPLNNCWGNLREATSAENSRNTRPRPSLSGVKGVTWSKKDKRWRAQLTINGKNLHLGNFAELQDAKAAAVAAREKAHGQFARHE